MTEPTEPTEPPPPPGVDLTRPNVARTYDYYLGGSANWAIDREHGDHVRHHLWPDVREIARENRDFLRRVVTAASRAGIRQFLDLGSGIPTVGNVHHVVRKVIGEDEDAKVVYVDNEPVAVAYARVLLEQENALDWAGVVQGDLRCAEVILGDETTRRLLDLTKPVCLLSVAVLHFFGDDISVPELLRSYADRLAPGSWLAFSHITRAEDGTPEDQETVQKVRVAYTRTNNPFYPREREDILAWLRELPEWTLVDPGLVHGPDWRLDRERTSDDDRLAPFFWCAALEKGR